MKNRLESKFFSDAVRKLSQEPHNTVQMVAQRFALSEDTIIKTFRDRRGVLKIGTPAGRGRRPRITLRIPESVVLEVYAELIK